MLQDISFSFRTLMKRPGFTLVALLTLALGIGANSAIFSLLDALYFRPQPFEHLDRLVAVTSTLPKTVYGMTSYQEIQEIRESAPVFDEVITVGHRGVTLHQSNAIEMLKIAYVSDNFFSALGVPMHLGRAFRADENSPDAEDPVVIVNYRLWQERLGGDAGIVGGAIQLNDTLFTVIGISPPGFTSEIRDSITDVWVTVGQGRFVFGGFPNELTNRHYRWFLPLARLNSGASIEQARAQLNTLARRWRDDDPMAYHNVGLTVESLTGRYYRQAQAGMVFLALIGLVLMIACANVANLTLARGEARRREIAIRGALGAPRGRLIRQLITESALLATGGAAVGLVFATWLLDVLPSVVPRLNVGAAATMQIDARVMIYTLAASLLASLMVGLLPAFRSTRGDVASDLKTEVVAQSRLEHGIPLRDVLVAAQIAICVIVLVAAGLLVRSLTNSRNIRPGFDTRKNLATFYIVPGLRGYNNEATYRFFEEALEKTKALGLVKNTSYCVRMPAWGNESGWASDFTIPGKEPPPGEEFFRIKYTMVGPDYFDVIGTRLLRGRGFDERDQPNSQPVVVITETMARSLWPGENPLGKSILMGRTQPVEREIVGVAEDLRIASLYENPEMYVYVPFSQQQTGFALLLAEVEADPELLFSIVRQQVAEIDPSLPVLSTSSMQAHMDRVLSDERMYTSVGLWLSGLALLLGGVGLYGVVALVTTRRTKELGIRLALGAGRGSVLRQVVGKGLHLSLLGIGLGIAGSAAVNRFLESRLYGVGGFDPVTFAVVTVVLIVVAVLASLVPAWRASYVDPIIALRYE
jgi:predicted permease